MIAIQPTSHVDISLEVPGSKSLTQRALIAAALAEGTSSLVGPLESDDTRYSSAALRQMGIFIDKQKAWRIEGRGGIIGPSEKPIYLGNNGTATRFLTSVASLGHGVFTIAGAKRMEERPIQPLMPRLATHPILLTATRGCMSGPSAS